LKARGKMQNLQSNKKELKPEFPECIKKAIRARLGQG